MVCAGFIYDNDCLCISRKEKIMSVLLINFVAVNRIFIVNQNSCQGISSTLGLIFRNREKRDHSVLTLLCRSCLPFGLCYSGHRDMFGCSKGEAVVQNHLDN